jgi:hypothetical protein
VLRHRVGRVGGLIVLVVVTACSQAPKACTLIGRGSTIEIDVRHVLANQTGVIVVRACVEATCSTTPKPKGRNLGFVFVDDPSIDDAGPVRVELSMDTEDGRSIYHRATMVDLVRRQPNGPDCEPTYFARSLIATAHGLQPAEQ